MQHVGLPVLWALSNHEDANTSKVVLQAIKARCPTAVVNTVMTDDGKQIHYSVNTCYICSDIKPMIMYMCVFALKMYGIDLAGASAITACFPDA